MGWGDVANGKAPAAGGASAGKGGWGSVANAGVHPDHQQQPHHGGSFLGSIGHFLGSKAKLAGHDIISIPGGTIEAAKTVDPGNLAADVLTGNVGRVKGDINRYRRLSTGFVKGTATSLRHPLRDPFQTAINVVPIVDVAGRVGEAGLAGREAGAAEAAKTLVRKGGQPTRTIRMGEKQTTLIGSRNAGKRLFIERPYDRMVQRAIDREAAGQHLGRVGARVAKHGAKRIQGGLLEEQRIGQRMRSVPAEQLDRSAAKLSKVPGRRREEQAALELTSTQTPAEEAAAYHYGQAEKGVNPRQNAAVGKLYERVAKRNLVHVDESRGAGEKVYINPAHERLAHTDSQLAKVQKRTDTILAEHHVLTPQQLEQRVSAPARIRAGASYEKPTPGKVGRPSAKLEFRRAEVNRLAAASERANERVQRMRFTAADRKRIGDTTEAPRDAAALREELRPLDKQLRQLTEDWNAPAKAGGRMTRAEAEARFAELDKTKQALLEKIVPQVSPYGGKISQREQLRRNFENSRAGKGKYRALKPKGTVKQEELQLAEDKLHSMIERNPDHPALKQADALLREHEQLHRALHENLPGEESPLPETGGASPYEKRARINRVLRKGTSAEKQVKEFAAEAGTDSTVHGLNDLKEQAADLTDRINELRGKPGPEIKALRREIGKIRNAIRDAEAPRSRVISGERPHVITGKGEIVRPIGVNHADRIGAALSVARDRLEQAEAAAERRVTPTGIVGGESAFPGRGFVSERVSQRKLARSEAASARGPIVGEAGPPIDKKPYTGRALEQGLRPKHVTAAVSRHLRQVNRFVNTDAIRKTSLETGSAVKRSTRDILVRDGSEDAANITSAMRQAVGQETSTVDTADELDHQAEEKATAEGLATALRMRVGGWFDKAEESKTAAIGAPATKGYRWVDENVVRGLQQEAVPRSGVGSGLGRVLNDANSAVTALTVYFKIGHIGTRVLTNAATNIMQGSLRPDESVKSFAMWQKLTAEDRARALAASGQHGFAALPHEEGNLRVVSTVAGKGAQWWARHADAPFRFNSLMHEFRKAGYTSASDVKRALDGLETGGHGLPAHEWSKISAAARRADREAISYDRLNPFEQRFLTRGIWFYPWIKGSTLFTVRSLLEHPYKSAILGNAGVRGRKQQLRTLGDVPTYEQGLVALGGGEHPLTTDLSTFSPFATAGDVLEAPAEPGSLAGFLNPVAGAAGQFAYGLNQYGAPSKEPYLDALLAVGAPTPEQQLAEAYASRHQDQSQRMFQKTPESTLLRYLIGPATPRRVNRAALAKAAKRERSGQR